MSSESRGTLPAFSSVQDVAAHLNVSRSTVFRLVQRGELDPPVKLSANISRWPRESVERFLRSRGAMPTATAESGR